MEKENEAEAEAAKAEEEAAKAEAEAKAAEEARAAEEAAKAEEEAKAAEEAAKAEEEAKAAEEARAAEEAAKAEEEAKKAEEEAKKKEEQAKTGSPKSAGIGSVTVGGASLKPGADFAAKAGAAGAPSGYQESPNCFGLGMDKIYTFGGVKVYTEPNGTTDIVKIIEVSAGKTSGGLGVGDSVDAIKAAAGAPASDDGMCLRYSAGSGTVDFYYAGGVVTSVELY